jgi:HAE1 family hydrophobic/amphiphilic exporter-1
MQKLADICIRRPVFAAMIILALVVVGAASYGRLGVDRFPSVDLPTVSVRTTLPGSSTEETEAEISQKIEEAVNTVEGIEELRSVSSGSTSFVIATFNLNRNIDTAAQDLRDRVAGVIRNLPLATQPPVISKFNNDSSPVMAVALAGNRSLRELTEYADKVIKIQLERAPGVGQVNLVGGLQRAINIWIDPDRLAAFNIPITAVRQAMVRQNAEAPGGNVTSGAREQTLRTMGRFQSSEEFNDLVVATINGQPVRVRDLGSAEDGTKEQRSIARLDGVPTVSLEILRQSGANTVEVINGAKEALARVQAQLPPDLKLEVIRDQSNYIYAALHEINLHLILGSIFASLVVFAFMRSWRSTVIAAVAIPTSVIATFGMMKALDFTLNSVTMLALVLMVGVVIDDAIVVLENIFRFIEEKKMGSFEAAKKATQEIGLAVLATTLSLVVIFVPVSFMSSISGRFLYQFGLTAAAAVLVSLLVSFTLTPMMSARMLRAEDAASGHGSHDGEDGHPAGAARSRQGFYARLDRGYERLLRLTLAHRRVAALVCLGVMLTSIPLFKLVKVEYIPSDVDESEFEVSVNAPEGTSLAGIDEAMRAIEAEIRQVHGIRSVLATAGGGFLGGVNQGNVFVRLVPSEERKFSITRFFRGLAHLDPGAAFRDNYSQRDVMTEVRSRLARFKDLRCGVRNLPSFNIGGGNWDIDFALRGPDLQALAGYAEQLRQKSKELGGIVDADTTLKLDRPELRVQVNRDRAAALGVDMSDIGDALQLMVGGDQQVSRFHDPGINDDYDVQLRLSEGARNDPKTIQGLYVPGRGGKLYQLGNLVTLTQETTASRVDRLDRQRQVSLRASVAPGYALADRLEALQGAVKGMNLPPTYSTAVGGRGRELARTYREFIWALTLSIIFMYMILASQFESVVHPLTILLSLPLAVPFAMLSLWATHNTLNLYSALGILVLFGVVKKNAILQIDHMNNLRAQGMDRLAAILQGNRDRLRPILMTTLALVAGMLPLAVGTGPGAEERRAIAVVVIGGQSLSLLLTLLATPVFYSIFDDLRGRETVSGLVRRMFPRREREIEEEAA